MIKLTIRKKILLALTASLSAVLLCDFALGQEAAPFYDPSQDIVPQEGGGTAGAPVGDPSLSPEIPQEVAAKVPDETDYLNLPSILFTYGEQQAIIQARNYDGSSTDGKDCSLVPCDPEEEVAAPPPEARYIRLGGILFESGKDWTIWLNKQRVTPTALPEEILDLKVHKEFIELRWYDEYTKQILPVRLRPHQSFHIDQRIFLPG